MADKMAAHPEIAFLPASPMKLTFPQVDRLIARKREMAVEHGDLTAETRALLDAMRPRFTSREQTIGEVATLEERERLDAIMERTADLEAAGAAISEYLAPWEAAMDPDGELRRKFNADREGVS